MPTRVTCLALQATTVAGAGLYKDSTTHPSGRAGVNMSGSASNFYFVPLFLCMLGWGYMQCTLSYWTLHFKTTQHRCDVGSLHIA